jgi:SAM-dependent methyltransferase
MSTDFDCARIYDAFAPHYREYSGTREAYLQGIDDLIARHIGRGRARHVLDFGAGDGVRGERLFRRLGGARLVQADISLEMLKRCRELGSAADVWDLNAPDWPTRPERFDLILCLWNVLGHVPTSEERAVALSRLKGLLAPGGRLVFDVNNRHNAHYGRLRVRFRRLLDWVWPDPARGDVSFDWKVGAQSFPARGHLFTRREVLDLLRWSGFTPEEFWTVDYRTGKASRRVTDGQMLFIARA